MSRPQDGCQVRIAVAHWGNAPKRRLPFLAVEEELSDVNEGSEDLAVQTSREYRDELHLTMIIVLCIFLVLLLFAGWKLKPMSTALHISASPIQFAVAANQGGSLDTLTETMAQRNGSGTQVELEDQTAKGPWTVQVFTVDGSAMPKHPAWRICTPHTGTLSLNGHYFGRSPFFPYTPGTLTTDGDSFSSITSTSGWQDTSAWAIHGHGALLVQVCWSDRGPESLSGGYLSADFPIVNLDDSFHAAVQDAKSSDNFFSQLYFPLQDASYGFTIQSAQQPTGTTPFELYWADAAETDFHVSASDTNELANESYHTFLSGLALGIAGGVLIAIVQEFLGPVIRRDDKRNEKKYLGRNRARSG